MFPSAYGKPSASVRVDKSACTPFYVTSSITLPAGGAYQTLRSAVGKGYLDAAIMQGNANASMRITVDSVVVFEGTTDNGSVGLMKRDYLFKTEAGLTLAFVNPAAQSAVATVNDVPASYPYTANVTANGRISMPSDSIYFINSLLVEVKSGAAATLNYYISGGNA